MSNYRIEDRLKAMGYDPSTLEENDKIAIATNLNYLHDEYIEEIAENPWYVPGGVINIYDDKYVPVTSIIINEEIPKLNVGDTYTINATVKPDNASFKQLLYNSGDASIVTIDKKGKITSKAIGTTTITVISDDNEAITAEATVEVKIGVTNVTVSGAEIVKTGTPQQLSVTVEPEEATYKEVTWSSSDTNVATVDDNGLVTAISGGNVTITATSTDNPSASGSHDMTTEVSVTSVTVSGLQLVKTGNPQQLSVEVSPATATHKEVTWSSSNTNVATVSSTGLVTAISEGTVTITATSVDNPSISGSHNMTAEVSVTSVDIQEESVEIIAGDTTQLHVTVSPEDATDKTVTWSSSDTSIATVDNTGLVAGVGDGEVTITVTSNDNTSLTDTCAITSKIDYSRNYFTTVVTTDGDITWTGTTPNGSTTPNTLSYSTDGGETWSTASSNITLTVETGNKVLWKGVTTPNIFYPNQGIGKFMGDANVRYSIEGNAMSLLFGEDFKGKTSLEGKGYAFDHLFDNNKNITSAENLSLPATTLANSCYEQMFKSCINLITAPKLPATTLADYCYGSMFCGCTNLTTAPELPVTTLAEGCYASMMQECTSLTIAPSVLPATTLANYCYNNMFYGCTNLTTAPELPATELADYCYDSMFCGCTSLTTVPELPATTLSEGCYNNMFYDCESLNSITCLATDISANDCTNNWVDGVAANGTFTKDPSMEDWTTGVNGIPSGWTVVDAS